MSAPRPLPYGRQQIGEDDIAAVVEVLRSDFLTTGPAVAAFDRAFADAVGARHAASCSSGTAALHLALAALGVGPGDAVIVPALTFVATANAARLLGAEVVFADVDPDNGLMGPADLEAALGRTDAARVRAVLPVHLNGQACDMPAIAAIARARGLAVVEDACHALDSRYSDGGGGQVLVGACAHSDLACFSFHPVKTVAMGEGGAVSTNDAGLADRLVRLRSHGLVRDPARFVQPELACDAEGLRNPWYHEMPEPGFNYRASDIHCALGLSQLRKLPAFAARRRALAARYARLLAPLAPAVRTVSRISGGDPCWHLQVALIDFATLGRSRAAVMGALAAEGIHTQVHYIPVHRQPYYRAAAPGLHLPGAEAYYAGCLSLPLFPGMEDADAKRVAAALARAAGLRSGGVGP